MSPSFSITESETFTITHANYIASKVAADLKRMQRFYGKPNDSAIENYEAEIAQFLKHGYLQKVSYGFQKNGNWIEPTLIYSAHDLDNAMNDDPGKIKPGRNIDGASFYSFLEYSHKWESTSPSEQEKFRESLPIQRNTADTPGIEGYLESDKTYSAGGRGLSRSSVRSY